MHLRRTTAALGAGVLLFACTACADQQAGEPGTWTDGVYEQAAEGKNGTFTVRVTIADGYIADIEVGRNNETADRGGVAIAEMSAAMLEAQSADVNGVTGATVTSNALRKAVSKALADASSV